MAPWDSGSRLPIDTDEEAQEDGAEGVGKGGGAAVRGAAAGVGMWPLLAGVL